MSHKRTEEEKLQADEWWANVDQALDEKYVKQGLGRVGDIGYKWLAINADISDTTIHNGRKRRAMPSEKTREKICMILGKPRSEMDPTYAGQDRVRRPHHDEVMDLWDQLDPAEILIWIDAGKAILSIRTKSIS